MKSTPAPRLPASALKVVVVQNGACSDRASNLRRLDEMLADAPEADLIALPEVFSLRGADSAYRAGAEVLRRGPSMRWLSGVAAERRCWVLGGSIPERRGSKVFNTSVLLDRSGAPQAFYRKIHLFEARLDDGRKISEHAVFNAGTRPVLIDIEGWRCGLAICYDIRFPELFRCYAMAGAHVFFAPANFTQRTGRDHWETLLRARAIENQCYVVAPNQCGANPDTGVKSYGNSMAIGPWGEALARAGARESLFTIELRPEPLRETRRRIPVLDHARIARITRPGACHVGRDV